MPILRTHAFDFDTPELTGPGSDDQDLSLPFAEVIAAIVTIGKSRADDLRTRTAVLECCREIRWREALLEMAISESGGYYVQSESYRQLDPSEKVGVSYMLGLAASNVLCTRFLDMPFLMHLDVYTRPVSIGAIPPYRVTSEWLEQLETVCADRGLPFVPNAWKAQLDDLVADVGVHLLPHSDPGAYKNNVGVQEDILTSVFGPAYIGSPPDPGKRARFWFHLSRMARKSRPDLFGIELDSAGVLTRCVIAEAKGRSGGLETHDRLDCQALNGEHPPASKLNRSNGEAMLQALSRSHVNGVQVGRHLAVFSYFAPHSNAHPLEVWHLAWRDPTRLAMTREERELVGVDAIVEDFYANLQALGCYEMAMNASSSDTIQLEECPRTFDVLGANFSVSFHPELYSALKERQFARIPSLLRKLQQAEKIGRDAEFMANGIRVEPRVRGSNSQMRSDSGSTKEKP